MAGQRDGTHATNVQMRALLLVTEAMDLLDAHEVSPEASAHLAMAQQMLRQATWTRGKSDTL